MEYGLAGFGREKDWHVDIISISGSELYGLKIDNLKFTLQLHGVSLEKITQLHRFMSAPVEETFHLHSSFGGSLDFVNDEGRVVVRILQEQSDDEFNNGMWFKMNHEEYSDVAAALGQAIEDAGASA